jgi:hypothetical protein
MFGFCLHSHKLRPFKLNNMLASTFDMCSSIFLPTLTLSYFPGMKINNNLATHHSARVTIKVHQSMVMCDIYVRSLLVVLAFAMIS